MKYESVNILPPYIYFMLQEYISLSKISNSLKGIKGTDSCHFKKHV